MSELTIEQAVRDALRDTRVVERLRSAIGPLDLARQAIVDALDIDPELGPEVVAVLGSILGAAEAIEAAVGFVGARSDVAYNRSDEDTGRTS